MIKWKSNSKFAWIGLPRPHCIGAPYSQKDRRGAYPLVLHQRPKKSHCCTIFTYGMVVEFLRIPYLPLVYSYPRNWWRKSCLMFADGREPRSAPAVCRHPFPRPIAGVTTWSILSPGRHLFGFPTHFVGIRLVEMTMLIFSKMQVDFDQDSSSFRVQDGSTKSKGATLKLEVCQR